MADVQFILKTKVNLRLDDGEMLHLPAGLNTADESIANHWFVKAHTEGEPVAAPAVGTKEAALVAAAEAEEKAKAEAEAAEAEAAVAAAKVKADEEATKKATAAAIIEKAKVAKEAKADK